MAAANPTKFLHQALQSIAHTSPKVAIIVIFLLQMTKKDSAGGRLNDLSKFILLANDSADIQSQAYLPTKPGNFMLQPCYFPRLGSHTI